MSVLIKGCILDKQETSILIEDSRIVDIGRIKGDYDRIIDGKNKVALPGFINTHTHLAMTMFRGIADDLPLKEWLEKHIWPMEKKYLNPDFCYAGSLLGCIEMIRSGTIGFVDQYFFEEATARAVEETGVMGFLAPAILESETPEYREGKGVDSAEKFLKRVKDERYENVTPMLGPHAPYTCSRETLENVRTLSDKYGVGIHIHTSETEWEVNEIKKRYGMRPIEYLDEVGILNRNTIAAHCVWLNEKEIKIMSKRGVTVAHNPVSNMKLASGIAPIPELIENNVNVTLGTDGCASNNTLNMFGEMKTGALIHKIKKSNPSIMPATDILDMATVNAYHALNLNPRIEIGNTANIILIDFKKPHLTPVYDITSHIVYAAKDTDVDTVICKGKVLMEGGLIQTIDEYKVMERVSKLKPSITS